MPVGGDCGWDLTCFGTSADRSAGLTALTRTVNEDLFSYLNTNTGLIPRGFGKIFGIGAVSETAAAAEWRVHHTTDPRWMRSDRYTKLQTAAYENPPQICRVNYDVDPDKTIVAELQNGGAVMDCLSLFISRNGQIPEFSENYPTGPFKNQIIPASFTATMTHVADSWSPIAQCVFDNFPLNSKTRYGIAGMSAYSATGLAHRLRFYEGPNKQSGPGILGGDSAAIAQTVFGDFGNFAGLNGVGIQSVAVAADATTCGTLYLYEMGKE